MYLVYGDFPQNGEKEGLINLSFPVLIQLLLNPLQNLYL